MKKNTECYFDRKQQIDCKYIQPFIRAIQKSGDINSIIQISLGRFQMEVADYHDTVFPKTPGAYLDDIKNAILPKEFKRLLILDDGFREAYIKLGKFYIKTEDSEQANQDRTIVREIFFDIINPIREFSPSHLDKSIVNITNPLDEIESQLVLPWELNLYISNFFQNDLETVLNYRLACREMYHIQKWHQDQPHNIYYAVSKPIVITRERRLGEGCKLIYLRDGISDYELLNAIKIGKEDSIRIFKTLFDAIEYAQFLQTGGTLLDSEDVGVMPAVMMVSTFNDSSMLESVDEMITLHEGTSSSCYEGNSRSVWINYSTVKAKNILPLAAISLYQAGKFADFHIFKINMNLMNVLLEENVFSHEKDKKSCNIL